MSRRSCSCLLISLRLSISRSALGAFVRPSVVGPVQKIDWLVYRRNWARPTCTGRLTHDVALPCTLAITRMICAGPATQPGGWLGRGVSDKTQQRVVCVRVRVRPGRTQAKAGGAQLLGDAGDDERLEREVVRDAAVGLVCNVAADTRVSQKKDDLDDEGS